MNDDTLAMLIVLPLVGVLVLGLAVMGFFVVRDTIRQKGRWGLGGANMRCPRCGEPPPIVRVPKNLNEMLWGGNTCERCGTEYDKYGREVEGDEDE